MATNWQDFFDKDPETVWNAKDTKSEAEQRRAKLVKSIDANIDAASKGEKLGRGFGKLHKNGSVYQITPRVGRQTVNINGKPYLTTPAERVGDALKALKAAAEAGEFDADIAAAFGDAPPKRRRSRKQTA